MARSDIYKDGVRTQFKKGNKGNPKGNPKTLTAILKEMGQANIIDFEVKVTDKEGNERTQKGKIQTAKSFNYLIAAMLMQKVVKGDLNAIKLYLERVEGKEIATEGQTVVIDVTSDL